MSDNPRSFVGLVPAAGRATRLQLSEGSKEVLPIAPERVAADCLLNAYARAQLDQCYVVLREGKWDIAQHFGDGERLGLPMAYLMMGLPWGTPFSLDQATPFTQHSNIMLGFPDIQFKPANACDELKQSLLNSEADIVLGLFPTDRPEKVDMVAFDAQRKVTDIRIKQADCGLTYSWILAAWRPRFSEFFHHFLKRQVAAFDMRQRPEIYVGNVFLEALKAGFQIEAKVFEKGEMLDVGTPEDLQRAEAFWRES